MPKAATKIKTTAKATAKKPDVQPVTTPGVSKPVAKKVKPVLNAQLIAQVIRVLELRQRKATSATKTRGDVSGGGRKPWKQKGTGRARAGSSRSPIWRGGGIVFGPHRERHYKFNIPTQMKRNALKELLDNKGQDGSLITVPSFEFKTGKTKEAIALLAKLGKEGTFLLISEKPSEEMKISLIIVIFFCMYSV
ncbi:50S ribosomal protein L4, partial [Candidatus Berkelbacteria bacterium]|nr:50S ribosomal protein L4 [Candidatus Berkelbacteria bacterium]